MKKDHLKDYYTKGFEDGRALGVLVSIIIAMAVLLIAFILYVTLYK